MPDLKPPTALWGVAARVEPLFGGYRNLAFRTFGLDNDLVFKTTRRDTAAIEWLLPVFALAEQCGFVLPWPVRSKAGRLIEQSWTCELLIKGEGFKETDLTRIGTQLALFHQATRDNPQRPGFCSARDLLHRDHGGDVDFSNMPPDIAAHCRQAWSIIAAEPTCVVHGDLNPGNLIWTDDGRAALLDWDECRVDAQLFDQIQIDAHALGEQSKLAAMAWEVACSWKLEPEYAMKLAARFRLIAEQRMNPI